MSVEVLPASIVDKSIIRQLMELYFHDLSAFESIELNEHGLFGYRYLDHYWIEDNRHPFLIKVDGKIAGFVLVNQHTFFPRSQYAIAEFFVLRRYRRRKIGQTAACRVFELFPGEWESHQTIENTIAQKFWRQVIGRYTGQNYSETEREDRGSKKVVQSFRSL